MKRGVKQELALPLKQNLLVSFQDCQNAPMHLSSENPEENRTVFHNKFYSSAFLINVFTALKRSQF